jgi:hypothetical protein
MQKMEVTRSMIGTLVLGLVAIILLSAGQTSMKAGLNQIGGSRRLTKTLAHPVDYRRFRLLRLEFHPLVGCSVKIGFHSGFSDGWFDLCFYFAHWTLLLPGDNRVGSTGGRGIYFVRHFLLGKKRRCEVTESRGLAGQETAK